MHLVLLVPVLFWISGPNTVRGQEQGSLTVQCRYDSSWKVYKKYWCKGADWSSCKILIQTGTSEQLVKKDRVSIRDNQTDLIVTVTMEDLRMRDADIYWCAIDKFGSDHHFKVNVNIDPGLRHPPWTCAQSYLPQKPWALLEIKTTLEVSQSLEDDLCYANLSLQQPRPSHGFSQKKGSSMSASGKAQEEEVEYVTM
ncbi:hypothetical protein STEG23_007877, partial [Scotinomys teguina]